MHRWRSPNMVSKVEQPIELEDHLRVYCGVGILGRLLLWQDRAICKPANMYQSLSVHQCMRSDCRPHVNITLC